MLYIRKLFQKKEIGEIDFFSYKYSSKYLQKVMKAIKIGIDDGSTELRSKLTPLLDKVEEDMKRLIDVNECVLPKFPTFDKAEQSYRKASPASKKYIIHKRFASTESSLRALSKSKIK
jgi:hypothetical protein